MRHIRPAITKDMAKSMACALVGSRLEDANCVLLGVSSKNIVRLQHAQNAAAWVKVTLAEWCIKFKIACIRTYTKPYLLPRLPTCIHHSISYLAFV